MRVLRSRKALRTFGRACRPETESRIRRFAQALIAAFLVCLGSSRPAGAKVFYSREELPKLAFPWAESVEPHDYILSPAQRKAIEAEAHASLDSDILTVYVGRSAGAITGYALIDTRTVRTLPETFLVVLDPGGAVSATHVLAFYEPLEYLPSSRWLEQLRGRRLSDHLKVGDEIAAITGSTLSSNAIVAGVRRAMAAYHVVIRCDSSLQESGPATDCSK